MKHLLILVLLAAFSTRCNKKETGANYAMMESIESDPAMEMADLASAAGDISPEIIRKVIYRSTLHFQVASLKEGTRKIKALVKNHDGYIVSSSEDNATYRLNARMVIRVETSRLDSLMEAIAGIASFVAEKTMQTEDVTEEYIDIETRLKNKREVENRYRELLSQAKTIKDILEVEENLRVIREEIESRQGRLNYLQNQVAYSTLTIDYYEVIERPSDIPGQSFLSKLKESLEDGWQGFVTFLLFLLRLWPFLILLTAGIVLFRRLRKARHEKRERNSQDG